MTQLVHVRSGSFAFFFASARPELANSCLCTSESNDWHWNASWDPLLLYHREGRDQKLKYWKTFHPSSTWLRNPAMAAREGGKHLRTAARLKNVHGEVTKKVRCESLLFAGDRQSVRATSALLLCSVAVVYTFYSYCSAKTSAKKCTSEHSRPNWK